MGVILEVSTCTLLLAVSLFTGSAAEGSEQSGNFYPFPPFQASQTRQRVYGKLRGKPPPGEILTSEILIKNQNCSDICENDQT